jgi:hypothetical protein
MRRHSLTPLLLESPSEHVEPDLKEYKMTSHVDNLDDMLRGISWNFQSYIELDSVIVMKRDGDFEVTFQSYYSLNDLRNFIASSDSPNIQIMISTLHYSSVYTGEYYFSPKEKHTKPGLDNLPELYVPQHDSLSGTDSDYSFQNEEDEEMIDFEE